MVSPDDAEWTEWCHLSVLLLGSGAARSAPSIVVDWLCHPSVVSLERSVAI